MNKLTNKEIMSLLHSLVISEDLKLKVNIKDDVYDYIATAILSYKGRKIITSKNSKVKPDCHV